jgi:hypothetical protein
MRSLILMLILTLCLSAPVVMAATKPDTSPCTICRHINNEGIILFYKCPRDVCLWVRNGRLPKATPTPVPVLPPKQPEPKLLPLWPVEKY